jgi:hypothetical protein
MILAARFAPGAREYLYIGIHGVREELHVNDAQLEQLGGCGFREGFDACGVGAGFPDLD